MSTRTARPETRYARSGDVRVAYQVTGSGPVDMVFAPGTVSHLDMDWEWPTRADFFEKLSSFCRLIRFDKRGTGMSDRPTYAATLEERIDDIRAVMDGAGSESAFVFGASEGGSMACLFGATYPSRTRGIIIWGSQARWVKTDDYPWGMTPEENKRMISDLSENGVTLDYVQGPGAGLNTADPALLDWFMRYGRAGGSPSSFVALEKMNSEIDIRGILPTLRVPALVMNRTGDPVANVEAARDLASRIPNAKFVEFPGDSHSFTDIRDRVVAEVEEFVTGTRWHATLDRVLATILFVDIVGSTKQLSELGDSRWRALLEQFNDAVRKELARFRGKEVRTTGDGFVATFDGPTRAIQCAEAIRDAVSHLGVEARIGLHTGECELMGDDVGGIAVHAAARISGEAGAGQILISGTVKDLVAGSGLEFRDAGLHALKGLPTEWHLYEVFR
ncbi:MAG TPA: adenylate/guanylate cyclase domain-containing protein [Nitrososphaerales archaeon]|nr:adenylate/guanylate cyclase domain-containing protein [Nitrososphaerales archaeon]